MQENPLERRRSIGRESFTEIDMPDDIYMLDISADKTRMAIIYKTRSVEEKEAEEGQERYMLRLYDLPTEENGKKAAQNKEFKERDVSFIMTRTSSIYIFLSCSGQSGYVALSFVEMSTNGQPTFPSDLFSKCYIYGNSVSPNKIPFQGRAVFMETKLALVGSVAVDIYDVFPNNVVKKAYTLDSEVLSRGYEAAKHHSDFIRDVSWAKFVQVGPQRTIPVAGRNIITMSRHISNNILVTQYGSKENGNVVRIWSILDGTLLTSYKSKNVEHVLAISDHYRYIATYDEEDKTARIYCTKTSVVLHEIPIRAQADKNRKYTLTYMRFFGDGRYLIISGFEPNTESSLEYRNYQFEVWCVPAQKLLKSDETRVYSKTAISPFAMEFQNKHGKDPKKAALAKLYENLKPGRQYNLPEMRVIYTTRDQDQTKITAKTLFRQNWIYPLNDVPNTWRVSNGPNPQEQCKITLLRKPQERCLNEVDKRPELNDPLNEFKNLLCYSIQMGTDYYILRFGLYTVQLWRLKEIDPSTSEAYKSQKGFQLEGSPYFYKSMKDNELVYIRAFKATDYGGGFTFKEDWRIGVKGLTPEVLFMDDTGHIFVEIEHLFGYSKNKTNHPSDNNSRELIRTFEKKWPFKNFAQKKKITYKIVDVDEIFLPISKTPISNNQSSTMDYIRSPTDSDFHEIESACRALCHINDTDQGGCRPKLSDEKLNMFNKKITEIIKGLFGPKKSTKYFTTISGSKTLAMLASFKFGQTILKDIITTPGIPINIASYTKENNERENVLTVLTEKDRDDLFSVFFNRVLTDSYNEGPGNLSAVMDALVYLQSRETPELLFNYVKKLSYIPINFAKYPVLRYEYNVKIKMKTLLQDQATSFRMLDNFSTLEKITKYDNTIQDSFLFSFAKFKRNIYISYLCATPSVIYWAMFGETWTSSTMARLCLVPIPRFNDYKIQPKENIYNDDKNDSKKVERFNFKGSFGRNRNVNLMNFFEELNVPEKFQYQKSSPFTSMISISSDNQLFKQGDTPMEVSIQYKWRMFARTKFFGILSIHIIYYICYSTAVTFPEELYNYEPGSVPKHPEHFVSIILMFLSGAILLLQEFREFRLRKLEYITSFYNWIDLAAITLPATAFGLLLTGSDLLSDVDSIAILILWTHAILRLRVFRQFGFILEIIIQLSKTIMPIIGIMILVIFAFTHAFIAQLRLFKNEYFQEQFQGGATDDDGNPIANATTNTIYDVSSSNNFSNVFRAFSMVWFFIFGVFDPINDGDVGDNTMTMILAIVFSFVTMLIFSNLVIALMSSTIEDVKRLGNRAWYFHFASVVAEIEMLWCTSRERYDRNNSPSYIYYVADFKTVKSHVESMRAETDRLIEELKRGDNDRL